MQELRHQTHPHQRLGAELRRRREAETDVRELRAHVVQQQVRVGGHLAVAQRGDRAITGAQRRHVAALAADARERLLTPAGVA